MVLHDINFVPHTASNDHLPADITATGHFLKSQIITNQIVINTNQFQIKSRVSKSNLM